MGFDDALLNAPPERGAPAETIAPSSALPKAKRGRRRATLFSRAGAWNHAPLTVALVLAVIDALYVSFSGELVRDARFETVRGWLLVAIVSVSAYVTTTRATAKLRRSEDTVRAILRSIGDGVLLVGGKDRAILDANDAAVRMLGVRSTDDLVGMGPEAFSRNFRLSTLEGRLIPPERYRSQQALQTGGQPSTYRATLHPRSDPPLAGPVTTISVTVASVALPNEQPSLAVSVMHDVTEEANYERMRDGFFANAAHALMTPLATLKTHAQLFERAMGGAPEAQRQIAAIHRQTARMDQIVSNLIVLSRLRSSKLELHMAEVPLVPLVDEVVRSFAAQTTVALRLRVDGAPKVFADHEKLSLALRNVFTIVLRSAARGAPAEVHVATREHRARITCTASAGCVPHDEPSQEHLEVIEHVAAELVDAHAGACMLRPTLRTPLAWIELPAVDDDRETLT